MRKLVTIFLMRLKKILKLILTSLVKAYPKNFSQYLMKYFFASADHNLSDASLDRLIYEIKNIILKER